MGLKPAVRIVFWVCGIPLAVLSMRGSAIGPGSFTSGATVINFDNLAGGNCNLCGPSVTNQYASLGVTFNNPSFPGEDTADTNLVPLFPLASPPNALFVEQGGMIGEPAAAPFQILFSVPVNLVGFDYGSSLDSFLQVCAYGQRGQLLETLTFVGSPLYMGNPVGIGLEGFAGIEETSPIAQLDVSYIPFSDTTRTFNFSIDNLEFQGSSVPEPGCLALVAAGLCAIAVVRGRRNDVRERPC